MKRIFKEGAAPSLTADQVRMRVIDLANRAQDGPKKSHIRPAAEIQRFKEHAANLVLYAAFFGCEVRR